MSEVISQDKCRCGGKYTVMQDGRGRYYVACGSCRKNRGISRRDRADAIKSWQRGEHNYFTSYTP